MDIDKERFKSIVLKAIECLSDQIDKSNKAICDKELLLLFTKKLKEYYCKKYDSIDIKYDMNKLLVLQTYVVDIICEVNLLMHNNRNVFNCISEINEKIHDSEINDFISKRKFLKR